MHDTARNHIEWFIKTYLNNKFDGLRILEIGSMNVNGSLREFIPTNVEYTGVDVEVGIGVDVVLSDPYSFPFEDKSFDIILSSSCFEHVPCFWLVFAEGMRVLKLNGYFYLNVPSNGPVHRFPVDCWRFYPDAGIGLAQYAEYVGIKTKILNSFIGAPGPERWEDFVAVFQRDI